jgi:hypothetical protein
MASSFYPEDLPIELVFGFEKNVNGIANGPKIRPMKTQYRVSADRDLEIRKHASMENREIIINTAIMR